MFLKTKAAMLIVIKKHLVTWQKVYTNVIISFTYTEEKKIKYIKQNVNNSSFK